ncbi:unnamed protein product [Penicillium pancosmium]
MTARGHIPRISFGAIQMAGGDTKPESLSKYTLAGAGCSVPRILGECYMGEPTLLAKDLYRQGLGKVLAVPAVNVAYSDEEAVDTRVRRGYVGDHVDQSRPSLARDEIVQWQSAPPAMVKCLPNFDQSSWTSPV